MEVLGKPACGKDPLFALLLELELAQDHILEIVDRACLHGEHRADPSMVRVPVYVVTRRRD